MQPGRFTELFFLDEATAFAAGHRPCALCRQRIANTGSEDLTFFAICTPRFEQKNYQDCENP